MKNQKILNISLFTGILLFSACSNSQEKVNLQKVSLYKIIGITEANNNRDNTYHQNISSDISYISYRKKHEANPSQNYYENFSPDITYISYKKKQEASQNKLQVISNIENKAKSFLGVPYVWGATGPRKFDCSGFTQWVYRDSGINIPRVSRDQARVGKFISYDNLQRGDMVFFDTKKKRTGRVSHVGIYLGGGDFIHASSTGKAVVIYNFNEKRFYKKRFLWGRRVLKSDFYYALN